jgi:hypothetical protein
MANHTTIKVGLFLNSDDEYDTPWVVVDADKLSVVWSKTDNDEDEQVMCQFTYEELRGIMAIMASHQEKKHLFIQASAKQN